MESIKIINNFIDKLEDMTEENIKEVDRQKILSDINELKKVKKEISIQNILQNNLKKALSNEIENCKSLIINNLLSYFYKEESIDVIIILNEFKKTYYHIKSVIPILEDIVGKHYKTEQDFFERIFEKNNDDILLFNVYFQIIERILNNQTKNMWNDFKDNIEIFKILKTKEKKQ